VVEQVRALVVDDVAGDVVPRVRSSYIFISIAGTLFFKKHM
jgi:hypothetical protein